MRAIMLATAAAFIMSVPMAAAVKAEDTTIIKKDVDGDRTQDDHQEGVAARPRRG